MLQSILFFALGFLCSGFLALMVAPAIWRRAVALTRRRIEASVPLSLAELQADKDRMRAELAMTIRRLEIDVKALREKSAAQAVELARAREERKRLVGEMDQRIHGLSQSEAKAGELDAELGMLRRQLTELAGKLSEAERALEAKSNELERIGKLHDEANFAASSRQIELVARQSELETLSGERADLVAAVQEAERRSRELLAENDRTAAVLREERRRADELAEVNARMEASLREREAAVADRDAQLADLREKLTAAAGRAPAPSVGGVGGAAASSQGLAPPAIRGSGSAIEVGSGPAAFGGADGRPAAGNVVQSGREEDGRQDAMLREQMSDLAAEVIRLAAKLEGPDSAIAAALSAAAEEGNPDGDIPDRTVSLADRVKALQRAASQ